MFVQFLRNRFRQFDKPGRFRWKGTPTKRSRASRRKADEVGHHIGITAEFIHGE
jgi:hypothetical protein